MNPRDVAILKLRFRQWRGRRRLVRAARLLESGALSASDYAFIAIGTVAAIHRESLYREKGWLNLTFSIEAAFGLGLWPAGSDLPPHLDDELKRFGPLAKSFPSLRASVDHAYAHPTELTEWMVERARRGRNDTMIEHAWHWGPQSELNLRRALSRLRWWNRLGEGGEGWWRAETERLPTVAKLALWVLSILAAGVAGWLIPK